MDFLAKFLNWDGNKPHILINQQLTLRWHCGDGRIFLNIWLFYLLLNKLLSERKKNPTHFFIAAVSKQLCRHLSTLFMSDCTICHWCWICQKWSEFDWQGPRASLSSFSTFQMLKKKKLDPPPRKAHLRVELGGYGYSLLVSVETLPPRNPIFLISSNYPPFSIVAFQWSHLFWGSSVRGSVVVDY